jgi:hypothetical protein
VTEAIDTNDFQQYFLPQNSYMKQKDSQSPNALKQLEARQKSLWALLGSYSEEVHHVLLVKPNEVKVAIDNIDEKHCIEIFKQDLKNASDRMAKSGTKYRGLIYEWYYGGSDYDDAYGYVSEECRVNGFSQTDLVKTPDGVWLEREDPELGGKIYEDFFISTSLVMKEWYDGLASRYEHADYTDILNTPLHQPFNDSANIYHDLFRIKLFMLVELASREVFGDDIPYIFMGLHERWPVLVAGE